MLLAGQFSFWVKDIVRSADSIIKNNVAAIQAMQGLLRKG